ncbi:MAG: hypothetical protein LAO19_16150 [Acidobacteriia bacterium]|nr:hypothetical protein [Terriglobia bacterium]
MDESVNFDDRFRIEVSGWGFDNDFFVEQTDLYWDRSGDKKVLLHHSPSVGGVVFVRLMLQDPLGNTLPVAYQVAAARPMDCNGQSEVRLRRVHPRTKVSQTGHPASYASEDGQRPCEAKENSAQLEHEEILQ